MGIIKRINKFAIARGTGDWGVVPNFGVNNGFYPQGTPGGLSPNRPNAPDEGAGMALQKSSYLGVYDPTAPSFQIFPYEDDLTALLWMALMMGNDSVLPVAPPADWLATTAYSLLDEAKPTVDNGYWYECTAAGTSASTEPTWPTVIGGTVVDGTVTWTCIAVLYTHTMLFQNESNYFVGFGWDEGSKVRLLPSAIMENLEIGVDGEGRIVFDATFKGSKIETGAGTELDTVTYKAINKAFLLRNTVLRINAQSDIALAVDNKVTLVDFKITKNRDSDSVVPAGSDYILQSKQGKFPKLTLTFSIPRIDTLAETLYDAYLAETLQKADIIFSGSNADRGLSLEYSQVKIVKADNPHDEVLACNIECEIEIASTAPAGITNLMPAAMWKTDIATSPLV